MAFPEMQPAEEAEETCELTFYNGVTGEICVSRRERPYPKGRLIVSRTDTDIMHANKAFVEISRYEREELIDQPQCVLRHPDVPSAVYEDLWNTIQRGEKWHGHLKNLCKDGSHYWVYATVIPNVRRGEITGYVSMRRAASRGKKEEAETFFKEQQKM